jgi:4-aminobutyrate aminotransferase
MAERELTESMALLAREDAAMGSVHKIRFYPLAVTRADGVRVWDADGNEYLDLMAGGGVMQTGFRHPRVRDAIVGELDRSWSNMLCCYPSPAVVELAERLCALVPGGFPKAAWFGTSGSDANDCLYKLVPVARGRRRLISFVGAYHGQTTGATSLSGHSTQAKVIGSGVVTKVPYPYCYRCLWERRDPDTCDLACLRFIEDHVLAAVSPADDTAAVLIEAMQSDGGDVPAPPRFLQGLRELCDRHGIWLLFDEVKSGLGRCGRMWAFEHAEVTADAVAVGKPLGGGLPLSAVVGRREMLEVDLYNLYTLGGSPAPCAAGVATLDVIRDGGLVENAARVGEYLRAGLRELQRTHLCIGDVRGLGLMTGFELVADRRTKEPAADVAARLVYRCFELGLVVIYCGLLANVIEMTPPLTLTEADVDEALAILDHALVDVEAGRFDDAKLAPYAGW